MVLLYYNARGKKHKQLSVLIQGLMCCAILAALVYKNVHKY